MRISSTARIVISLVALATSLLLIAGTLGFFPDRRSDVISSRQRLSESLALTFATMATQTDMHSMTQLFQGIAERNQDVRSIGLRKSNGMLLAEVGSHQDLWDDELGDKSSETQITVPVDGPGQRWGAVEITFEAITQPGLKGILARKEFTLTAFMAISLCVAYYLYLRRVLKQLNPSKVIPGRVREAFDSLAEGILVMDAEQNVVLANRAFEEYTGRGNPQLLGRPVTELPFSCRDDDAEAGLPWAETVATTETVNGRLLGLDSKTYSVSSAPIIDERGASRGVLASFEDVTQLRDKKEELLQIVGRLHESTAEIQRQNQELEQLANFDPLTGCHNRRSFFEKFDAIWHAAVRYDAPLSAIMVDIDHFKSINDSHGHSAGDDVLRKVAKVLWDKMRDADILCRYGGEEFAVLLPHTDIEQAELAAERYRLAISELRVANISVTVSLGVSSVSESPPDPQGLLDQADKCLYVAKRNGRNQVVRWDNVSSDQIDSGSPEPVVETQSHEQAVEDMQAIIPYHAVTALVSALAFRDQHTATHSRRVADLSVAMGEGLLSHKDCYTLEMAALLHDIGKIGVPDAILLKPDQLTDEEWKVMQSYACIGAEIIHASFASEMLTGLVRTYRQRYDDRTRPLLSVSARILAIADAYDSMTTEHAYRPALSHLDALEELQENAGSQFDPELVERLGHVLKNHSQATQSRDVCESADIARSIGSQIERLVAALDDQDLDRMSVLADRLEATASRYGSAEIAHKATELQANFHSDEIDLFGVMQTASELLDLCRSTQDVLLKRPELSTA